MSVMSCSVTKSCEPKGGWSDHKIINHQVRIMCGLHEVDGLEATVHHCVSDTTWQLVSACLKVMQRSCTVKLSTGVYSDLL